MKPYVMPTLLSALIGVALAPEARAANYCVSTSAGFAAALAASASNGQDDRILLVAGTYTPPGASGFTVALEFAHALTVEGGYIDLDGACEGPAKGTGLTVLDGAGQAMVLAATASPGAGAFSIANLTIAHGYSPSTTPAGLRLVGDLGYDGSILVDDVVFRDNVGGFAPAALLQTGGTGQVRVRNAIVAHNTGSTAMLLAQVTDGNVSVVNSTFADNTGGALNSTPVQCSGPAGSSCAISNSIFQGNLAGGTPYDVDVIGKGFFHSIIVHPSGAPGGFGNFVGSSAAATFVDAAQRDYRLAPGSRGINVGLSSPFGGLPASDIDGESRLVGPAPDLGAHESDTLLRDGFE